MGGWEAEEVRDPIKPAALRVTTWNDEEAAQLRQSLPPSSRLPRQAWSEWSASRRGTQVGRRRPPHIHHTQSGVELEESASEQVTEVKGQEDEGPAMGLGSRARALGGLVRRAEDACSWDEAASPVSWRQMVGRGREPLSRVSQVLLPQGS